MSNFVRARSIVTALAVLVVTTAGLAGPAWAGNIESGSTKPGQTTPTVTSGDGSDEGGTYTGEAGGCTIVSSASFLGARCARAGLGELKSIKSIIGNQTFHECWLDPMTAEEHQSTNKYDSEYVTWFMNRCITGIDPKTLDVIGPITITKEYPVPVNNTDIDKIVTLESNQADFVRGFSTQIPYPIATTSPTSQPRVGGWLSFADGQTVHEVNVPALGVLLTAKEDSIIVKPMGASSSAVKNCPGTGHIAAVGEKPDPNGNCWFQYPKSSADQPGDTYPVKISAHWTVTQTVNGVTTVINQFTKSQVTQIPVTEIQAINVQ